MTKAFVEDGAHHVFVGTRGVISQIHERIVVTLYLIVEWHLTDIDLMLQTAIQIGSLLEMNRHVRSLQTVGIIEEPGPEQFNILLPQSRDERQFFKEDIVAMRIQESLHDELLGHHLVGTQKIASCHQSTDG